MSLGERIRQARQSKGLTQAQLGGHDFSKSFISLIERGFAAPSVESLLILAQRLGVSLDALAMGTGNVAHMVADGLLTLSADAHGDHTLEDRYLETADLLAQRHGLDDIAREAQLR
ncbi:MAG: helix-turn-helix domain-containing protein, partial [Candidatus Methylomirabilaceae bacterium]